jgi:ATP-dependent Zn protease
MDKTETQKNITIILVALILIVLMIMGLGMIYAQPIYEGVNYINSGLDEVVSWRIYNNNSYINASQFNLTTIIVTIPELSSPSAFAIEMKGYKNEEEKVIHVGGGTRTVWRDRNNTIYVDKPRDVIVEKEVVKEINNTIVIENTNDDEKPTSFLWVILSLIIGSIFLIIIVWFFNRRDNEDSFGATPVEVVTQ